MKMMKEVYQAILHQMPDEPPEIGGIIGGKEGIVSVYEIDRGQERSRACSYVPNVEYLNFVIRNWLETGLEFYGIFHTHFFSAKKLSNGDVVYIKKIMEVMPDIVTKLFFPVFVLPEREMIVYVMEKKKENIYKVPLDIVF